MRIRLVATIGALWLAGTGMALSAPIGAGAIGQAAEQLNVTESVHCRPFRHWHRWGYGRGCGPRYGARVYIDEGVRVRSRYGYRHRDGFRGRVGVRDGFRGGVTVREGTRSGFRGGANIQSGTRGGGGGMPGTQSGVRGGGGGGGAIQSAPTGGRGAAPAARGGGGGGAAVPGTSGVPVGKQ